ncbi:MAG TPA: ferredoxin reductase [Gordonia sp. (in: high G+C Gram-positive bacteria)]|uniref:ferredoxin reductase n=1 Tax=unclassified Gordonia (in: high G+C Gram-positive bacteria) TaxID=2657482 RepID=UPI0025C62646|nr:MULTISPECIES: ferredoxin reductase [unclassified Gordonia (in: high G+C Gram-positive bacteria)]HNP55555.1 ferredoxin reductase [Gordonia sp. (in: high G+C Gram-positive bacteria)]HRC51025.1 ferredoxin reductase [Gordonia sp. (in: high G+C Gram-positive bacteria)]
MPEAGARVEMPAPMRLAVRGLQYFTWPLKIDDYISLINPLWSTVEAKGRIERIHNETPDAVTVFIVPGFRWRGHKAGQYLRVGFDIDGKRYWRAYSLSTDASRPDGQITITVKRSGDGIVSNWLNSGRGLGALVTLGEVEGQFILPEAVPRKLLFITAGSGITPVMAMLRALERAGDMPDVVHLHSAKTADDAIFGPDLTALAESEANYNYVLRETSVDGRIEPSALDELCPDWRDRQAYACGPGEMLDAFREHALSVGHDVNVESFEHMVRAASGQGGTITFQRSGQTATCGPDEVILDAGEAADLNLPYGCRIGICHTCVGRLVHGEVRDLRTGDVMLAGTEVRTCVNCPEGDIVLDL